MRNSGFPESGVQLHSAQGERSRKGESRAHSSGYDPPTSTPSNVSCEPFFQTSPSDIFSNKKLRIGAHSADDRFFVVKNDHMNEATNSCELSVHDSALEFRKSKKPRVGARSANDGILLLR